LEDVVVSCGQGLFESIGLLVAHAGIVPHGAARWADMVSVIGLGGANLRGSLVLSVPSCLLRRTHPTGTTEELDLADWQGELANLLLGRIKARLLARNVIVELATPVTIRAGDLSLGRFACTPFVHTFEVDGEALQVGFQSVAQEGAALLPAARERVPVEAGEILMFDDEGGA
jgi:CheY-specific phosphatase CheX